MEICNAKRSAFLPLAFVFLQNLAILQLSIVYHLPPNFTRPETAQVVKKRFFSPEKQKIFYFTKSLLKFMWDSCILNKLNADIVYR